MANLAVARGVAAVVITLLSSVRTASLSTEMKRSRKEKQAADKRGERRGTTLVSVWHGVELGLLKLQWSWRLVWLLLGWRGCLREGNVEGRRLWFWVNSWRGKEDGE